MKPFFRVLGWIIGVGLFVWLLSRIDRHQLWISMLEMSPRTIVWLAGFTILSNASQGLRFYALWPGRVNLRKHLGLPFLLHTGNILLPLRVGEAVAPLTLKRWAPTQAFKSILFWVFVDKALEIVSFTLFVATAAILFNGKFLFESWNYRLGVVAICFVAHAILFKFLKKAKVSPRRIGLAYLASLLVWICNGMFFVALLEPLEMAFKLFVGTSLASALPLAPGGLGTYEVAFKTICQQAGLSETEATARALSAHSISILTTLLIGLPLGALWGWPKTKGENAEGVPTASPGIPTRYLISNVVVYISAIFIILGAGAIWVPDEVMPKRKRRLALEAAETDS